MDEKSKTLKVIIGTSQYTETPNKNIIQWDKLFSTVKIKKSSVQAVSPQGIQFENVSLEKVEKITEIANTEEELNDPSNKNLQKADIEQNFENRMLNGEGWFLSIDNLRTIFENKELNDLLESLNRLKYTEKSEKLNITQTKTLVESQTIDKKKTSEIAFQKIIQELREIKENTTCPNVIKATDTSVSLTKEFFKNNLQKEKKFFLDNRNIDEKRNSFEKEKDNNLD